MAMARLRWRPPGLGWVGVALLATGLALFLGLVSAILPGWFIFATLMIPAVAVLMFVRPEYTLTACVALVCGLIHPALVPRIPVLGGSLAAADATLLMLFVYTGWALATQPRKAPAGTVPGARLLGVALALFGASLAVAVVLSLTLRDVNTAHVLGETRDLLYLSVLPIAVVILRQRERQKRFVVSFVVLGCLFAVGQVLQGVFNLPVFGATGISVLETLGRQDEGTTRANTLGLNVIVFALLLTLGARLLGVIRWPLFVAVAGLLFVGIFLTFGRTTFAAVIVCAAVVVWWLNPKHLPRFFGSLLLVVALGSAIGLAWKPDSFAAIYYRMTSIGEEIDRGYSAQWRIWEFEAMLPQIQAHPFVGIGLGADYKGANGSSVRPELNRYMHNAYFYMAGKMGLPALGFFLLAMAAIFAIGRRTALNATSPWERVVGAAGAAMVIRYLFASVTEPHLMSDYGVVNLAIGGALVVLSARGTSAAAGAGAAAPARRFGAPAQPARRFG
jgi:hypothetical protein